MNVDGKNSEEKLQRILTLKRSFEKSEFFANLPNQFHLYFELVEGIRFCETPNYGRLKGLFKSMLIQNKEIFDYDYDWILHEKGTLKLPPSFGHISTNFFYRFEQESSGKQAKKPDAMMRPLLKGENQLLPLTESTAAMGTGQSPSSHFMNSNQGTSFLPQHSPSSQKVLGFSALEDSGISFYDDMDEYPNLGEQLTKLHSYRNATHTFEEVKSRFSPK